MKLFFVFPVSGPINGVKIISNHIKDSLFKNSNIQIIEVDTSQSKGYDNFGKFSLKKILSFFLLLKKLINVSKTDIIYLNITPKGFAFYRDLIFLALCKFQTKNITIHIHANGLEKKIKRYNKKLFSGVKIIVINTHQKKMLSPYFSNIFLVSNCLPDYYSDKEFEPSKNELLNLIFISNISKEKGIYRLKEICQIISNKNIICNLNVYGGSLTEECDILIKQMDTKYSFLKFHGPVVVEEEKFKYLHKNDVLLFLSDKNYEVYPLVYIEALMNGLHILTTNQVVANDLCTYGVAQLIKKNLNTIENTLVDFTTKPNTLRKLKHKSREVYLEKYSFSKFINRIEDIILYEQ